MSLTVHGLSALRNQKTEVEREIYGRRSRQRSAAHAHLPAARDERYRRYQVRAGRPQAYPVILLQSAGRRAVRAARG